MCHAVQSMMCSPCFSPSLHLCQGFSCYQPQYEKVAPTKIMKNSTCFAHLAVEDNLRLLSDSFLSHGSEETCKRNRPRLALVQALGDRCCDSQSKQILHHRIWSGRQVQTFNLIYMFQIYVKRSSSLSSNLNYYFICNSWNKKLFISRHRILLILFSKVRSNWTRQEGRDFAFATALV